MPVRHDDEILLTRTRLFWLKQRKKPIMTKANETVWSADKVTQLRGLWMEGHSAKQIGRMMQITKNSVIGKVHRLLLPARASPLKKPASNAGCTTSSATEPRKSFPAALPVKVRKTIMALPVTPPAKIVADAASAIPPAIPPVATPQRPPEKTLRSSACQWPSGQPGRPGFRLCGEPALLGKPYCEAHCCRAFVRFRKEDGADQRQA